MNLRDISRKEHLTQQLTSGCSLPSRNPCDLSVDLDETLFGFGRELGAGLDGRMERAATLDRFAPITSLRPRAR